MSDLPIVPLGAGAGGVLLLAVLIRLGPLFALFLLATLVGAAYFAYTYYGKEYLEKQLKAALEEQDVDYLGVDLTVDAVRMRLLTGVVELDGLTINNPKGYKSKFLLHAKQILLDLDMWALITSKTRVVTLERAHFKRVDANYEWLNFTSSQTNFDDVQNFVYYGDEKALKPQRLECAEGEQLQFDGTSNQIARAWYGKPGHEWTEDKGKDVTSKVKELLDGGKKVSPTNDVFGDPAPYCTKKLQVRVAYELKPVDQAAPYSELYFCPEGRTIAFTGAVDAITRAWYGDADISHHWYMSRGTDVTEKVKEMLANGPEVTVSNKEFGDPAPSTTKALLIRAGAEQPLYAETLTFSAGEPIKITCGTDRITSAWYGDASKQGDPEAGVDVAEKLKELLSKKRAGEQVDLKVSAKTFDLAASDKDKDKVLAVRIGDPGRKYTVGEMLLEDVSVHVKGKIAGMVVAITDTRINIQTETVSTKGICKIIMQSLAKTVIANVVGKEIANAKY